MANADNRKVFSKEYVSAVANWLRTGGKPSAALYEGAGTDGGYALPSRVAGDFVQIAQPDSAIRRLATVIPTTQDLYFPVVTSSGTAAAKPESGASVTVFSDSSPTLGNFKLSAFMAGSATNVSLEIFDDVTGLMTFLSQDGNLNLNTFEEGKFLNGSGIGEPQGLLGNTGAGVVGVTPDASGYLLPVSATYDVLDTLKDVYHQNASWLMSRGTGTALRRAQAVSGVFEPVFTRSDGQDYLHGYPVEYSASMPAIAAGATPVLFGDFAMGYLVGQRGEAGTYCKYLDQALMLEGLVQILLYRRVDGRIRRSEALQAITLHS